MRGRAPFYYQPLLIHFSFSWINCAAFWTKKIHKHFLGIHRVYVPYTQKKLINCIFKNRDISGFIESRCKCGTAMKKSRTAVLNKLDKTFICLLFIWVWFYFVCYYKSVASTDIAANQVRIHLSLKICSSRSNSYFRH